MLPFFEQPAWHLGPLTIHAFGVAILPLAAMGRRKLRFALTGAVILATAWACWSAPAASTGRSDSGAAAMVSGVVSEPRTITGGRFEASGVAHVPGSHTLLFVDDGEERDIFAMELARDGAQRGQVVAIPFDADVTDPEGMTSDGTHFYVVGSQSKRTGFDGDGLVRFRYDPARRDVEGLERIEGLKAWLAANVPELRGTERRIGDEVLNIEAVAWDPTRQRLLLGLRAPVVDGQALIVPVRLASADAPFVRENLRADSTIRLPLGGAGIRSLEYDGQAGSYRVIAGASLDNENRDFELLDWDGQPGSTPRPVSSFPKRLKPEGITRATIDGQSVNVIVFDVGRFLVLP